MDVRAHGYVELGFGVGVCAHDSSRGGEVHLGAVLVLGRVHPDRGWSARGGDDCPVSRRWQGFDHFNGGDHQGGGPQLRRRRTVAPVCCAPDVHGSSGQTEGAQAHHGEHPSGRGPRPAGSEVEPAPDRTRAEDRAPSEHGLAPGAREHLPEDLRQGQSLECEAGRVTVPTVQAPTAAARGR